MAVYQGNALDYAIWINGDGSYSIVDAHFDDGGGIVDEIRATGDVNLDGLDLVSNVEQFLFLNSDGQALYKLGFNGEMPSTSTHVTIDASNFYVLPDQDHRVTGNVALDGTADATPAGIETVETPVGWGLTAETAEHGFAVTGAANVADGLQNGPLVAKTEDSFVAAWQTPNADGRTVGLHLTVYEQFMDPVPTAAGAAIIDVTPNALASVSPALASAGAGPVIAWVSADGKLLAQAFDANGAALAPATGLDIDPDAATGTGYSSLSVLTTGLRDVVVANPANANDPIELDDQFAVVWIENAGSDGYGTIHIQRYALPLASDGITVDAPVALGLDGKPDADGIDDGPVALALNGTTIVGRNVQAAGLEDGQLLLTWVENAGGHEVVRGTVLSAVDGQQEMPIDLSGILSPNGIAAGTSPMITSAGEADILVSWVEADPAGGFQVKAAYYKTTGPGIWDVPLALDLKHFAALPTEYSVVVVGESTEDIILTWRGHDGTGSSANDVHGQRYGVDGTAIGDTFEITSGQTSTDTSSTAGLLDGRFVVVHTQQDGTTDVDIRARVFDTNNAIDPVIERDAGGPRGAEPGTVFDDIIDGRDREDILHGGLGNDVLIGGVNDDTLFGDSGHDVLIGGTGTDILVGDGTGDSGNDVLMGGYGRDYISGGAGVDTLSYKGEARAVDIDLESGMVRSDPLHNAVVLPAAGSIAGLPAAAFTDTGIEDLIGRISIDPITEVVTFTAEGGSIENAEGSLGNDTIRGTSGSNVLTGLAGDDLLDGRGGDDTAVFRGERAQYIISSNGDSSFTVHDTVAGRDGTDMVLSIEQLQFADGSLDIGSFVALNDTLTLPAGQASILNVLANDVGAGLTITSINGAPVQVGGAAVVLTSGSLELLTGGVLRFTPNVGFAGPVAFDYTVNNADHLLSTAHVNITVKGNEAPTAVAVENVPSILETNANALTDTKVGDIVIVDDGLGRNAITLSGTDIGQFKLVGSELFLKAGAVLDAETKPSYNVHISVSDPALGTPVVGTDFNLQIGNINEAPTGIALSATSVGENAIAGTVIGTLSALDPDFGDKAGFELTNNAGGAFALIGNQIVVANPALLDFEASTTKTISVLATDAGGLQLQKDVAVSLSNLIGTSDNVIVGGTANANTLNGTTGNDFIAGLGGDDTLNGNAGNDILDGGAGKDNMTGGAGDDSYLVDDSGDKVTESSGQGTDTVVTTLSNYTLATNVENLTFTGAGAFQGRGNEANNLVIGGTANDQLQGDKGNDTLVGAAGNDTLDGGDGNDYLVGAQGSDSLLGGKGTDRLEGGAGNDVLTGGNDADVFVFKPGFGSDVVTDFAAAGTTHDTLELTSVFHSLVDLQAAHAISQVGADTVITLTSDPAHLDQITLRGVAVAALTADHFWFL